MSKLDHDKALIGLASIGARLYDDDPVTDGSIADAERYIWARLFSSAWRQVDDQVREYLRLIMDEFAEEFERAVADAERRRTAFGVATRTATCGT